MMCYQIIIIVSQSVNDTYINTLDDGHYRTGLEITQVDIVLSNRESIRDSLV